MPEDINYLIPMLAIKLYSSQDGRDTIYQWKRKDCAAGNP